MNKTPNIGLHITPADQDDLPFLKWRTNLDGDDSSSNMMMIDSAIKDSQDKLDEAVDTFEERLTDLETGEEITVYEEKSNSIPSSKVVAMEGITSYEQVLGKPIHIRSSPVRDMMQVIYTLFEINNLGSLDLKMPLGATEPASYSNSVCMIPSDVIYTVVVKTSTGSRGYEAVLCDYFPGMAAEERFGISKLTSDYSSTATYTALSPAGVRSAVNTVKPVTHQAAFTLQNAAQVGSTSEWTINVTVSGVTADSILWISPAADCTTSELELIAEHQVSGYKQGANTITFIARNGRPETLTHQFKFQVVRVG